MDSGGVGWSNLLSARMMAWSLVWPVVGSGRPLVYGKNPARGRDIAGCRLLKVAWHRDTRHVWSRARLWLGWPWAWRRGHARFFPPTTRWRFTKLNASLRTRKETFCTDLSLRELKLISSPYWETWSDSRDITRWPPSYDSAAKQPNQRPSFEHAHPIRKCRLLRATFRLSFRFSNIKIINLF